MAGIKKLTDADVEEIRTRGKDESYPLIQADFRTRGIDISISMISRIVNFQRRKKEK